MARSKPKVGVLLVFLEAFHYLASTAYIESLQKTPIESLLTGVTREIGLKGGCACCAMLMEVARQRLAQIFVQFHDGGQCIPDMFHCFFECVALGEQLRQSRAGDCVSAFRLRFENQRYLEYFRHKILPLSFYITRIACSPRARTRPIMEAGTPSARRADGSCGPSFRAALLGPLADRKGFFDVRPR